jgi:hypothetical protein
MLHRVQPTERYGLPILESAPAGQTNEEVLRLSILQHDEILDTPPEAAFERIAALAGDLSWRPSKAMVFQ